MESKTITIDKIEVKKFPIKIKGTTDLLMHGKTSAWAEWYEKEREKKKGEKKKGTPEEEAERTAYKNNNGNFIIPARNISRMLRDALGVMTGFTGGYKKLYETSVAIFPDEIPLKFKQKTIDKATVTIGRNIPDFRYRYKFTDWKIEFDVLLRSSIDFDEKRFFILWDLN